jgi:hypothetical protein
VVLVGGLGGDAQGHEGRHRRDHVDDALERVRVALIIVAAIVILRDAYDALQAPKTLDAPLVGVAVNVGVVLVGGLGGDAQGHEGRHRRDHVDDALERVRVMERAQAAALASAGVGLLVLGLKFFAWWITGSLAIISAPSITAEKYSALWWP